MTGSIPALAAATLLFVLSHLLLSYPPLRQRLVAMSGEMMFRGGYSLLSVLLLAWVALAYRDAPIVALWHPPIGLMHLSLLIMPLACVLLVAGLTSANPASIYGERVDRGAASPSGILAITRHPVMWAITLWGLAHLLANGDLASVVLFGGMTMLALAGACALDRKRRLQQGEAWNRFAAGTSFLPFAAVCAGRAGVRFAAIGWWRIGLGLAVFALLLWAHRPVFGVSPLPL